MRYFGIIGLMFVGTVAVAGLDWEMTAQEIIVHPLQASAVVRFGFSNSGSNAVSILDIKSDCGCLSGQVDKMTYEPGESGAVTATFDLQGRSGLHRKKLLVITDEYDSDPIPLIVSTTIPFVYNISPQRLTWVGGQRAPQSFSIINVTKTPFRIERAVSSKEGISVELKAVREGFEYELVVTPDADLEKTLAPIIIYPEKPEEMDAVRTYTIFAMVL